MNRALAAGLALICLGLLVSPFVRQAKAGDSFKIVVVVNGVPITQYDVDEQMELVAVSLKARGLASPAEIQAKLDEERPHVIERMIEEQLMAEEVERLNLNVDEEQVKSYIDNLRKENNLEDEAAFDAELAKMQITREQFFDKMKEDIQKQRLVSGMVKAKVVVTETEIDEEFAKHPEAQGGLRQHLRAIIVPTKEEMDTVVKSIDDGMSFAEAAKQFSQGPVPEEGGDLGFIATVNLASEWSAALEGVEVGKMSEPFEAEGRYILLELVEQSVLSVDDIPGMRDKLYNKLRSDKMSKVFDEYMGRLREMAVVEWK